jgi:hypothetical protein
MCTRRHCPWSSVQRTSDIDTRVTRTEVASALQRIHWRHAKVEHHRRSGLSDDPAGVLEHLTRHSATLPQWVIAADTLDALVLSGWLWWEDRRRERSLLRRGLHAGLTHRELGTPLGIATRQGLRDRLDRLDALLTHDHPDEKLTRGARHEAAQHDVRSRWVAEHEPWIRSVLESLFQEIARLPRLLSAPAARTSDSGGRELAAEAGEWLAELRTDLEAGRFSPATLSVLGLALGPLRILIHDQELDPAHGLWRAIRAADHLRAVATHPD